MAEFYGIIVSALFSAGFAGVLLLVFAGRGSSPEVWVWFFLACVFLSMLYAKNQIEMVNDRFVVPYLGVWAVLLSCSAQSAVLVAQTLWQRWQCCQAA